MTHDCFAVDYVSVRHSTNTVKVDHESAVAYPVEEVDHSMHKYFVENNCSYNTVAYHVTACQDI